MIDIKRKQDCSGCHCCFEICPKQCIEMEQDLEGFLYPHIKKDQCIGCNLCEERCPYYDSKINDEVKEPPIVFGAYSLDWEILNQSSSGGVFSELANYVLDRNGIVFGASFNEIDGVLSHQYIEERGDLLKLCGSKYVQSTIGDAFKVAEDFLKNGRLVLFSGTPCQIEGLCSFLGKTYDNLICTDFICHGVPSPLVWKKYLDSIKKLYKGNYSEISFRNKKYGWRTFSLLIRFSGGKSYRKIFKEDDYGTAFLQNATLRPSCYNCVAKKVNRVSDFTLGDFWGNKGYIKDNDTGISLVFIHSEKGKDIWNIIKKNMVYKEIPYEKSIDGNSMYYQSVKPHPNRDQFFKDIKYMDILDALKKNVPSNLSFKQRLRLKVKKIIKVLF